MKQAPEAFQLPGPSNDCLNSTAVLLTPVKFVEPVRPERRDPEPRVTVWGVTTT